MTTTSSAPTGAVVVGIDDSESSALALDWAAGVAAAWRRELVLLTAVSLPVPEVGWPAAAPGLDAAPVRAQAKERARAVARRCTDLVHEQYPDLDVRHDLTFDDPRAALLDADAGLVVVGTRGRGQVRRLLLGSVASAVVKHATRPTVVVRAAPAAAPAGVLVGVAGDAGDPAVVDLAFAIAAARGLPVTACHSIWDVVGQDESRDIEDGEPRYRDEWELLARAIGPARRRHPGVEVHLRLTRGFADQRLLAGSRTADVVVVGHRRKAFLNELVYGSLAPRVVEHSSCTVVVVPYHDDETGLDG